MYVFSSLLGSTFPVSELYVALDDLSKNREPVHVNLKFLLDICMCGRCATRKSGVVELCLLQKLRRSPGEHQSCAHLTNHEGKAAISCAPIVSKSHSLLLTVPPSRPSFASLPWLPPPPPPLRSWEDTVLWEDTVSWEDMVLWGDTVLWEGMA